MSGPGLDLLTKNVRACTLCASDLKHGVRPVLQISPTARILIAGQAPGSKVHKTGIPFDDASGDRLRQWMGVDKSTFYDASRIAILPMGFCYPGKGKSGDLAPRRICAETWRQSLLTLMPDIRVTLVIGQYAQAWHLQKPEKNLTETVRNWQAYGEGIFPLPHPSPRNNIWMKKNTWFETNCVPVLQQRVQMALS